MKCITHRVHVQALGLAALMAGLTSCTATADQPKALAAGPRTEVARSLSPKGMMVFRRPGQESWEVVPEKGPVYSGDLVLGVSGARIDSADHGVMLRMRTDFDSPLPVLEPAVVLHPAKDVSLDFTLDRGRVDLRNMKEEGPAKIKMHAWNETWDITLNTRDSIVAVELLGRWPAGSKFTTTPGPKDVPSAHLLFLVLQGEVEVALAGTHHLLHAPPGPAMLGWNNFAGKDPAPEHLDKLPTWSSPRTDPAARAEFEKRLKVRDKMVEGFATKTPGEVMDMLAASDDPLERKIGVVLMGAFDDLPRLGKLLNTDTRPDVWDNGVRVLRHWLGRCPGQDQKLYKGLTETKGFTPVQAETLIEFLHGFSDDELHDPATYQMLINFLAGDKLAIRGLAHWHLIRLVPGGVKIPFNPLAPKEAREKARDAWKKLVPPGDLPKAESEKPKEDGK